MGVNKNGTAFPIHSFLAFFPKVLTEWGEGFCEQVVATVVLIAVKDSKC